MNICSIDPRDIVEQVADRDLLDEISKHVFNDNREIYQKPTNRFMGWWTVEATLQVEQFILQLFGDFFGIEYVAFETVQHTLEQFWWFMLPCSPPRVGGEHGEISKKRELNVLKQRQWNRIHTIDTVGYNHASSIGTPGCRISSRSYSRQYE